VKGVNMKKIVYIGAEDWEVLYVDGLMFAEGHHINEQYWFELGQMYPNYKYNDIKKYYFDENKVEKLNWDFPEKLEDIPKKLFD
jgi:hypothetical protein